MTTKKSKLGFWIGTIFCAIAGLTAVNPSLCQTTELNRKKIILVYATKTIPANTTIKDEDLQETWVYEGKTPPRAVPCRNFAVGYRSEYGLQEGQIISEFDLKGGLPVIKPSELNHTTCSKTFTISPRKTLAANSIIEKNNLCTESVSPFDAPQHCVPRVDSIAGAKTKNEIKAGQIITNELIEPARQKGER